MTVAALVTVPRDPEREAALDALVALLAGSMAMLNTPTYGGYAIDDEHLWERARAQAALLVLEYPGMFRRAPVAGYGATGTATLGEVQADAT